jgi:Domain of Unknown Function (DUF1080)
MHTLAYQHSRRAFVKGATSIACLLSLPLTDGLAESTTRNESTRKKDGYRSLFDGITLKGWSRQIRETERPGLGVWAAQNGMIIGEQDQPTIGSYLVTDDTFSDFELELEARPDWRTDTGVYIRTNAQGNVGFQACIDYRPHGSIGGYYGNGIGGFHACDYCFTGESDKDGRLVRLIPEKPSEPLDATHHVPLDYAVSASAFVRNWNLSGWNHFKIRSVGAIPFLTTWINGLKVSELDTTKMKAPDWASANVDHLVGRAGHIALEVHGNRPTDWLKNDRWYPGNVCRWRNIYIKEL